ncbi:MAG: glycosyltransferase [Acetobacteraceae bacterium]|nr:glycosyltransferase [Acetobacteraceae bacterium]
MTAPLVLFLSNAHPPDDPRTVRKEGAALAGAGWRVLHLCPGRGPHPPVGAVGVETFRRRGGWAGRILALPGLIRRARRLSPAAIHAQEPDSWLAALAAARLCGARAVLDVHEHYPSRLDSRLPAPLRPAARAAVRLACRAMGRAADAVVVAKDGLAPDFAGARRIVAVRNYAPLPPLPPRRHRPGPITLVHLGALSAARGAFRMLEALSLAPPGTRLLLIGRFTDDSAPRFAAEAEARGLAGRIEQTGWLPQEAALARAAEADVGLVLFQRGEENHRLALPHKLFDCMALGLPVIVPDFAEEVSRAVAEAGCGIALDPADPRAIAAALARLADPALRARLGAAGREAVRTRFSWPAEAARLVGLYDELLPRPAAPARAA